MTAALTLTSLGGVVLFAIALGSLAFAAGRVASLVSTGGAERLLASAALAGAAAVLMSLALGVVDLGSSQVALTLCSVAVAVLAAALLPAPAPSFADDLRGRFSAFGERELMAAGAGLAVALAWAAFALHRPSFDLDSAFYNLPQIAGWVDSGRPGSIELISFYYPIGNYQLTNEVLSAWFGSVSQNMGVLLLWPLAAAGLLLTATYTTLRALRCEIWIAALASLVLLLVPIVAETLTSLDSDLPSTAWAMVAVALCARVATGRGSPELIAVAIVALGLAIGTKATVAPLGLAALVIALVMAPRRPRLAPVLAALVAAVAVGGVWYLRNLIDHGNPLWPFTSIPGSDPLPETLDYLSAPFIGSPLDTLENRVDDYLFRLGAGVLLVVSAIVLPLLTRVRNFAYASGAVALSLLLWMTAPATGEPEGVDGEIFQVSGARYLVATVLLAILVLAVVASRRDRVGIAARAVLAVGLVWGLAALAAGRDGVPPAWLLAVAALAGAAAALAVVRLPAGADVRRAVAIGAAGLIAILAGLGLATYPDRFLERFGAYAEEVEDPLEDASATYSELAAWFDGREDFTDGDDPVVFTDVLVGPLTGGRLAHDLDLLANDAPCEDVDALADGTWMVVGIPASGEEPPVTSCLTDGERELELNDEGGGAFWVYRLERSAADG